MHRRVRIQRCMSILTDLELVLDFGHCNGTMDVIVESRQSIIKEIKNYTAETISINTKIELPNTITLQLSNKNYGTDTKLNSLNEIIHNKYVQLKQLKFGGIIWDSEKLFHLCAYNTDQDTNTINTTFWDKNGTITIDFFDKHFIQFHLHYNNLFKLYT